MNDPLIRMAEPADADNVLALLRSVATWLETDGPGALWPPSAFRHADIAERIRASTIVVLHADGALAACMSIETSDDVFWPDAVPGEACYVHKLAVDRRFAGSGLSRLLLDWAALHAGRQGRCLRLDCAPRPKLVKVYTDAGFYRVGDDSVVAGFLVARLQRDVT